MKQLIESKIRGFSRETKANVSVEAAIIFPIVFWAYAAMFTYFEAYRAQAVAEKAAYTISDMLSRETLPITPTYMTNVRAMYQDLSGNTSGDTSLRVTLLRWDENNDQFDIDWSQKRGTTPQLPSRSSADYEALLPPLVANERIILVETSSAHTPSFSVGLSPRNIETLVFTRPRFAPQIVWNNEG